MRFTDHLCKSHWSHCGFGMESENIEPETCGLFLDYESHTWWVEIGTAHLITTVRTRWGSEICCNYSYMKTAWNQVSRCIWQHAMRKLTIPRKEIITFLLSLFICAPHFKPDHLPSCILFPFSIRVLMTPVIKTDELGRQPKREWPWGCLRAVYRYPRNGYMDV